MSSNASDKLSAAKRALLEQRLRGGIKSSAIKPRPDNEPLKLSFAQERIWFLNQLDAHSGPAYNMHDAVRIRGMLNIEALQHSLDTIIQRHEALRTTFGTVNGQVSPLVAANQSLDLAFFDLVSLDKDEQTTAVRRLSVDEAQRPFDLTQGPLLRATVLQLTETEFVLLITLHHIISDEWSNEVFWRELALCYAAYTHGSQPTLPNIPLQYTDFAHWQRQSLSHQAMQTQLEYWRDQLVGMPALLQLPLDHPRPATQTYVGALTRRVLSMDLMTALRKLSQSTNTTLFVTLLTAFQVLLHRYTGQETIPVGIPVANREQTELKNLIGMCLNTLVIRADFADNPAFTSILNVVQQKTLEALSHQTLPFEKLVSELRPTRDLSYHPLFQVMHVHQQDVDAIFQLPGLDVDPIFVDGGVAKFDLTLFTHETPEGLEVGVEHNTDLFEQATIDHLLNHYETLLTGIADNPAQPILQLPLLNKDESETVSMIWNQTYADYPADRCIHHFIEEQVVANPEQVAVVFGEAHLTYTELNQRANQLAHELLARGVQPGCLVGLCVDRSVTMIVALLGILKSGAAYIPIDPAYPVERITYILNDMRAADDKAILITQQKIVGRLEQSTNRVIDIDGEWATIAARPKTNPDVRIESTDRAYVIYTSGSTGQPKGVVVTHRNLVHSTLARFQYYAEQLSSFLLLSSYAFDSSVVGIYWSLCSGGTLILTPERIEQDVAAIGDLVARHGVTHTLCLPSLYQLILEHADPDQLQTLRCMMVAGEACGTQLPEKHFAALPHAHLYNEYGPTEGTVWSTAYQFTRSPGINPVSIGKPIPNMRAYVLDEQQQLVPIGVPGELYIGGDGVAEGYLNQPELTAERFIVRDLTGTPERLYRTGDLVRWLRDGNLQFLGRADEQVKIRGYRIEPGEIENRMLQHPMISDAVVLLHQSQMEVDADDIDLLVEQLSALDPILAEQILRTVEEMHTIEGVYS